MSIDKLVVRGAREHNLKNVSIELPRNALIVFTGLSGSGKSSLAFDTIFAEGQRRYVESLSAYARQFLGQMDKPDVDFIEGLSPAVSIDQKSTNRNPRSTVGTITEVYDYLRLLFARAGRPHCPSCGKAVSRQSPQQIVDQILAMPPTTKFQVLAPVIRARKGEFLDLFTELITQGYSRARVDGEVVALNAVPKLKKQEKHSIEVVIDRLSAKVESKTRLTDSIETALRLASGIVILDFVDSKSADKERTFSEHLACHDCNLSFEELEPRSFSFNSPFGACPECSGIGTKLEVDQELIIPDDSISINDGAIAPWSGGQSSDYLIRLLEALAKDMPFSLDVPWKKISVKSREAIINGYEYEIKAPIKFSRHGATCPAYKDVEDNSLNFPLSSRIMRWAPLRPIPGTRSMDVTSSDAIALLKSCGLRAPRIERATFGPIPETVCTNSKSARASSLRKPKRVSESSRTTSVVNN